MGRLFKLSVQIVSIILILAWAQTPGLAQEKNVKQDISVKVAAKEKAEQGKSAKGKTVRGKIVKSETGSSKQTKKKPKKETDSTALLETAEKYLGAPYRYGGETPKGFDCSGYVMYVFDKHGKTLPRDAEEQFKKGDKVSKTKLKEGDLVFFTTYEKGASHVGIYFGKNSFIHVSSTKGVMVSSLDDVYWKPRYLGARRV